MQVLEKSQINITEMDCEDEGRLMVTARFEQDQPLVIIPGYVYHFVRTKVVTDYGNGQTIEILSPHWMT